MTRREYTPAERASAVSKALAYGSARRAAHELGYPVRTVASWIEGQSASGQLAPILAMTQQEMAKRMWETLTVAVDRLDATLANPSGRLGEVAKATEILLNAHRLLSGQSTGNLAIGSGEVAPAESAVDMLALTDEQREALREALRQQIAFAQTLERLRPGLAATMDGEYQALGEKWHSIAEGREPLALGPGIIEGEAIDVPLTPAERVQLAGWLRSTGQL